MWTAEWEASLERRALLFAAENQQKRDAFKMLAHHQDTINIPWDVIYHYNIYIYSMNGVYIYIYIYIHMLVS